MKLYRAMELIDQFEGDFRVAFDVTDADGVVSTDMFPNISEGGNQEPSIKGRDAANQLKARFEDATKHIKEYSNVRLVDGKGQPIEKEKHKRHPAEDADTLEVHEKHPHATKKH